MISIIFSFLKLSTHKILFATNRLRLFIYSTLTTWSAPPRSSLFSYPILSLCKFRILFFFFSFLFFLLNLYLICVQFYLNNNEKASGKGEERKIFLLGFWVFLLFISEFLLLNWSSNKKNVFHLIRGTKPEIGFFGGWGKA